MDERLKKLERNVEQQGYLLLILMVLLIVDTAALLILWGEKGDAKFDHIAVSLTVFQIMFAIAAVYGFWALRGLTREKAEDVAKDEVARLVPPLVRRQVQADLQSLPRDTISDVEISEIVNATGDTGKEEDGDGK